MRVPGVGASCLGVGHPGSGALPPLTSRPFGRVRAGFARCGGGSPEQKTPVHAARAERHEATHRALSPGGRWRASSCTAWQ